MSPPVTATPTPTPTTISPGISPGTSPSASGATPVPGVTPLAPGTPPITAPGASGSTPAATGVTPVGPPATPVAAGTTTTVAPMAHDDNFSAPPGALLAIPISTLLANDISSPSDGLQFQNATNALNGMVSVLPLTSTVLFQPSSPTFAGAAQFQYSIADRTGATSRATVHLTYSTGTGETVPMAAADNEMTGFNAPITLTTAHLLSNDTDTNKPPGGQSSLSVVDVSNAQHGMVSFDPTKGQVVFTPDQNFVGTATFQYVATDSLDLATKGTVSIMVQPPQITAQPDTVSATGNTATTIAAAQLLANDKSSAPGDSLHIASVGSAQHGTVALDQNGDVLFTPDNGFVGAASFTSQLADQFGGSAADNVTVNVTAPTPAPPPPPSSGGGGMATTTPEQTGGQEQAASTTTNIQQIQQIQIQQIQQVSVSPTVIVQQPPSNAQVPASQTTTTTTPAVTPPPQAVVFFDGTSQAHGSELWSFNGQTVGELADINPGSASSFPAQLAAIGGSLFLSADDGTHGREPWTFDGQNTRLLADINPGSGSSDPQNFTQVVTTPPSGSQVASTSSVYFSADDGTHGRELWVDDPNGNVHMVTDINPGANGSSPTNLTAVSGTLFFSANDGTTGQELWKVGSDGKPVEVANINPGSAGSNPNDLTPVGNTLFFTADDGTHGRQLFSLATNASNGQLVEQVINPGTGGAFPAPTGTHDLLAVGNTLYFIADVQGQGIQLFGETSGGTPRVLGTLPGSSNATLASVQSAAAGHDLYFAVFDTQGNSELARFDISTGKLTPNILPDQQSAPAELTAVNNQQLFFTTLNHTTIGNVQFRDLWTDNGQTAQRIELGSPFSLPQDLEAAGKSLFYADHGQLQMISTQGALTPTTLTVAGGQIYVPLDITAAHPETGMLGA
jgi:ELWxxDGT repeat protein